ncbi:MAG TPA: DEAD/DEAH box helicase [Thermoanaerobaculia bacterium]|nr:DEAD/DEAH box helicase [Thermoanaerobaculia bacterium]
MSFSLFGLHPQLLANLSDLGLYEATPEQRALLPSILAGGDLLIRSPSSSSRTLCCLVGAVQRLLTRPAEGGRVLLVTGSEMRAAELLAQGNALAAHTPFAFGRYGDRGNGKPVVAWATSFERLEGALSQPEDLSPLELLVIEEPEASAASGELLARLVALLPSLEQRLILTASSAPAVRELAEKMLRHPVVLEVGAPAAAPSSSAPRNEAVFSLRDEAKGPMLLKLLAEQPEGKALIFTRTRFRANRLSEWLNRQGHAAERIHGDRTFRQRSEALAGFKNGSYRVLVTTDIAARGLDVEGISHLIHFDVPSSADDYRERLERTPARPEGLEAVTLVSDADEAYLRAIERGLGRALPRKALEEEALPAPTGSALELGEPERQPKAKPAKKEGAPRKEHSSHSSSEDEEESRIRAMAEAQQAAAVAARMSPSRMGIMEYRAPRPARAEKGQGPARRKSRSRRSSR